MSPSGVIHPEHPDTLADRVRTASFSLRRVLANRDLRRLEFAYLGFIVVELGTWVAVLVYANSATGPASIGIVAVAQLVPAAVFAPIGASLADRYDRERVQAASYGVIGLAVLGTGLAMLAGAPPFVVYAGAITAATLVTLPRPIQSSLMPEFAETPEELTSANAVNTIFEAWGGLLGPLLAGLIMAVASPGAVFVAAAVLAVGAMVLVMGVRPRSRRAAVPDAVAADAPANVSADGPGNSTGGIRLLDGMRAVAGDPDTLLVVLLLACHFLVLGALDVFIVILATDTLDAGDSGAGYLNAALGLGAVVGGAASLALAGSGRLSRWLLAGAVAWAAAVVLVSFEPGFGLALGLFAVAGLGVALFDVAGRTLLQRVAPREVLSGVFGLVEGFSMAGMAAGSLVAGVAYEVFGLVVGMIVTAALVPVVVLLAWVRLGRLEVRTGVPSRQIVLLRNLELFASVSAPTLAAAARGLVRTNAPAGVAIIREGEPGDRFFVVGDGTVEVSRSGRPIRTLGQGESFGQIALLRDVPRTATVLAVTDVELWTLDRDAFLFAITGSSRAAAAAQGLTDALLDEDRRRGDS